jgi:WD40 repeat protein
VVAFCGTEGSGERAGCIGLWNPATGRVEYPSRESKTIPAFALSPNRKVLAVSRPPARDVVLSDFPWQQGRRNVPARGVVTDLAFLDDRSLISGDSGGTVKLWDARTRELLKACTLAGPVTHMSLSPRGRTVAVATRAEQQPATDAVIVLSVPSLDRRQAELRPDFAVRGVAFSPDGGTIAVAAGGHDHHVTLWRPFDPPAVTALKPPGTKEAWSVTFSPDSRTLAVGYDDEAGADRETLKLWDVATGRELANLPHQSMVTGLGYLPDGHTLVSAGYNRLVKAWDTRTQTMRASFKGNIKRIRTLAVSPDGNRLAAGGDDKVAHVWDANGAERLRLENDTFVNRMAFAPNGRTLAAADHDGGLIVWDAESGRRVSKMRDTVSIFGVAYSPDGRLLATANRDGMVKLHDLEAGGDPRVLVGHKGQALCVAFSPDGKTLATGGDDRTVRLWRVATGREVLALGGLPDKVHAVAFSPDGRHLASALHDGSVRVWHAAAQW